MKICFIGPANSAHIVKWCNWFGGKGHDVHVISFTQGIITGTTVHLIDLRVDTGGSDLGKLKYLTTGRKIKKLVSEIEPDIVNVHYATSYGMAVALSGIKNYVLSVWGSDIYDFPKKSPIHKLMLKYSLKKAPHLFSTSKAMADEASQYTDKHFEITPFGVDMKLFNPDKRTRPFGFPPFTIGTVKTLADIYGIDYIIKAAAILNRDHPEVDIQVRISGDGPDREKYEKLIEILGIRNITTFLGRVSQEQVAREWANMDVAVIPSVLYESFGVAAVEAQASNTPVIISDVEGLKETTSPNASSIVVPRKNEYEIAEALWKLYESPELRYRMGESGRAYVNENFELNNSFINIEKLLFEHAGGVQVEIVIRQPFVVGTVKGLSDKYGIADILHAVDIVRTTTDIPIRLRIAGKGPQEEEYHQLADELGISDITTWLGFISQEEAAKEWANMDVALIPSTLESESFGVSAVEAQACGTPVIISDIPGLMEATKPGRSSLVIKRNQPEDIERGIEYLSTHEVKKSYRLAGLKYTKDNYELNRCFEEIEHLFWEYSDAKSENG